MLTISVLTFILTWTQLEAVKAEEANVPALFKCCPDGEFFDQQTRSCQKDSSVEPQSYSIIAELSSTLDNWENYFDGNGTFVASQTQFPKCDPNRSKLHFLISKVEDPQFILTNITGNELAFLSDEESLQYKNICVERAFRRSRSQDNSSRPFIFLGLAAVYCRPVESMDCRQRPCVQSCCSVWQVFDVELNACRDPTITDETNYSMPRWDPILYDPMTGVALTEDQLRKRSSLPSNQADNSPIRILYERPLTRCRRKFVFNETFEILDDGSLRIEGSTYGFRRYCINYVEKLEPDGKPPTYWTQADVCEVSEDSWTNFFHFTLLPSLFVVSIIFLCLLFAHIWRKNKDKLFGSMMLSTVGTLIFMYIFLTSVKFSGSFMIRQMPMTCSALGFLIQLTYLSAFFWINAISFDIWVNFRSLKSNNRLTCTTQREIKFGCTRPRYRLYALYAWGAPFLVVVITIMMQFIPDSSMISGIIRPLVGKNSCLFGGQLAHLLYLHLVAGPVLCANVIFFVCFVYNLCWGVWAANDMICKKQQQSRMKAVMKMFFVMGITWIADVLTWGLQWALGSNKIKIFSMVCDVINGLQGFIMFCVVYFDRETIKHIRNKWKSYRDPRKQKTKLCETSSRLTTTTMLGSMTSRQNTVEEIGQNQRNEKHEEIALTENSLNSF